MPSGSSEPRDNKSQVQSQTFKRAYILNMKATYRSLKKVKNLKFYLWSAHNQALALLRGGLKLENLGTNRRAARAMMGGSQSIASFLCRGMLLRAGNKSKKIKAVMPNLKRSLA